MTGASGEAVLVTGAAGFIGFHLAARLLRDGRRVVGFDNLNPYYDPALKRARLAELARFDGFEFVEGDIANEAQVDALFEREISHVAHLAAQAGVRYSFENPHAYGRSNLTGFLNVIEACRRAGVRHLAYASSSSVYGANAASPHCVDHPVDHPLSLYAATKKANESIAHAYAASSGLSCTGLRFFTVYGPWGRPDMAMWIFADSILSGKTIRLFNNGRMRRDFTYVADIVEAVSRVLFSPARPDPDWSREHPTPSTSFAPHRIFNIGNHAPVEIEHVLRLMEKILGRKAVIEYAPIQIGDVPETFADVSSLQAATGFIPQTSVEEGVRKFLEWHGAYRERMG